MVWITIRTWIIKLVPKALGLPLLVGLGDPFPLGAGVGGVIILDILGRGLVIRALTVCGVVRRRL